MKEKDDAERNNLENCLHSFILSLEPSGIHFLLEIYLNGPNAEVRDAAPGALLGKGVFTLSANLRGFTNKVKNGEPRTFSAVLNEDRHEVFSTGPHTSQTFEWVAQNDEDACHDLVDSDCRRMHREQVRFRVYMSLRGQAMRLLHKYIRIRIGWTERPISRVGLLICFASATLCAASTSQARGVSCAASGVCHAPSLWCIRRRLRVALFFSCFCEDALSCVVPKNDRRRFPSVPGPNGV